MTRFDMRSTDFSCSFTCLISFRILRKLLKTFTIRTQRLAQLNSVTASSAVLCVFSTSQYDTNDDAGEKHAHALDADHPI